MNRTLVPFVCLIVAPAVPALAQDRGCDIQTSSYVRIVPPHAPKSALIVAAPQTPCPVLDTGPQPQIGPIIIDVKPDGSDANRRRSGRSAPRRPQVNPGDEE